jgi:hypothetical protein
MARPIEFESWVEGGLHTYRYTSREGGPFERNWSGLFEEWPEHGPTPWTEYAVNNNNCEEVAVYLGLIWRLTEGLVPYGVPRYHRDDAAYAAGAPFAMVSWEYEVGDGERGDVGEIAGFVPARSSVRTFPRHLSGRRTTRTRQASMSYRCSSRLRASWEQSLGTLRLS